MNKYNQTGRVSYDEKTKTFSFPTPKDPDYWVGLDGFRSVSALLNDVVFPLRGKHGVAGEQLLDLLCCAAAVIEPTESGNNQSQSDQATVSYDAEHDCFDFPHPLDRRYWVQHPRCMTNLLIDVCHWRDSGFPDAQIVDFLILLAEVEDRRRKEASQG